jgi:hypothetical protein
VRSEFVNISILIEIEPMLVGLLFTVVVHLVGFLNKK